jgi:hypothetical protein
MPTGGKQAPLPRPSERLSTSRARSRIGRAAALTAAIGVATASLKKQAPGDRRSTPRRPKRPSLVIKRPAPATAAIITAVKSPFERSQTLRDALARPGWVHRWAYESALHSGSERRR